MSRARHVATWIVMLGTLVLTACQNQPSKQDEEAAKNTFACESAGERIVIRFDRGEVRLLMANGDRVTLYEVPSATGQRYTNGSMDLIGARGTELQFARNGNRPQPLQGCAPFAPAPDVKP